MTRLSVVGLGKLGACTAVCFAYRGFEVLGLDINQEFVDAINTGKAPVSEPRLQDLITAGQGKLRASQNYDEILGCSDITFVIVPTPSREDGHFSNDFLMSALEPLAVSLKKKSKPYHLFVITSTVSPGATEKQLIPFIEKHSGRRLNEGFGVCYNPEFIALGSVITDFLNPDLVLLGESSPQAGNLLEEVYKKCCENNPYIARMSLISAEIAKISLNSYVTMKISFANTLANICEKIPGADVDAITISLGADKRISPYYLKGGLGFGGPCFPRDNRAFAAFAKEYGVDAGLARATDRVNQVQIAHLVDQVIESVTSGHDKSVAVIGLAYKPNTPVIDESPSIILIKELLNNNLKVTVYDPLAMDTTRAVFQDRIVYSDSLKQCVSSSSICVLATPMEEIKTIDASFFTGKQSAIIDCWRVLDPSKLNENTRYVALGRTANDCR